MTSIQMNSLEPTAHLSFINGNDKKENIVEWLKSGEFTPELFMKHLPHTARDISHGLWEHDQVSWCLMACYIWNDDSEATAPLKALSCALIDVVLPATPSPVHRMKLGAMVASFLYYRFHRQDVKGSVIHVTSSLVDAIKSIRSYVLEDEWVFGFAGGMGLPPAFFRLITLAHEHLTETQFVDTVLAAVGDIDTEAFWRQCEMMRRMANVLLRLSGDYLPLFYTCWECNQVYDQVFRCGHCKAALYCSRKCQVSAWKGGHKKKCGRLKTMRKCYDVDIEEMERVHVTGMLDGLELSPQTDCVVSSLSYQAQENGRRPASIKIFYENLGRINSGEWWAFDLSDEEKCAAIDKSHPDGILVLELLTTDWFARARSTLGTDSVDPEQVTALTDPVFRRMCSAPMSAEALLEIYRAWNPVMPYRPLFKASAQNSLRHFHDHLFK